jgi:hypothetical protein
MLEKNPELNELTGITVAGFRKSMDKLGRVFKDTFFITSHFLMMFSYFLGTIVKSHESRIILNELFEETRIKALVSI